MPEAAHAAGGPGSGVEAPDWPDGPGRLDRPQQADATLQRILADTGASVHEVYHDRQFGPADIGVVNIVCVLETRDAEHIREIAVALAEAGIAFEMR